MAFCTLFDANYTAQGLALLRSIYRHHGAASVVVVLAMDNDTAGRIRGVGVGATPIVVTLDQMPPLYHQRAAGRSVAERCWMATPFLCDWTYETYGSATYLDADCFLFARIPYLDKAECQIVPHNLDKIHRKRLAHNGTYNVGYIHFGHCKSSRSALNCWLYRTVSWRESPEQPRFNDQLFLEDWPKKFDAVVLKDPGLNLAPYNQLQRDVKETETGTTVDGHPLLMYHCHEWEVGDDGKPARGGYALQWAAKHYIYKRYEQEIGACLSAIT